MTIQIVSLLGADLPDPSDHEASKHGTLTRCDVDGQLWPCSTIEEAQRINGIDLASLEMVDVGWHLTAWTPEQIDRRPRHGRVVGYTDDEEKGRIFRVLRWRGPRPVLDDLRARDVDDIAPPNSLYIKDDYRRLCRYVGKQTGTADGTETRNIAMALLLAQAVT